MGLPSAFSSSRPMTYGSINFSVSTMGLHALLVHDPKIYPDGAAPGRSGSTHDSDGDEDFDEDDDEEGDGSQGEEEDDDEEEGEEDEGDEAEEEGDPKPKTKQ
ncbi:hypothetical protein NL676_001314 [Syzygium grande]|nr:hypothetical protein NL676_001314 [Syzygium grande]